MRDSSNGRRYGRREHGRIIEAYGFDLSPLAARFEEFQAIAAAHAERRREARCLRGQIGSMRNQVLSLTDAGQEHHRDESCWLEWDHAARRLADGRNAIQEPATLASILRSLADLHDLVQAALVRATPVETDLEGSDVRPGLTPTNPTALAEAQVADGKASPQSLGTKRSQSVSDTSVSPTKGFTSRPAHRLDMATADQATEALGRFDRGIAEAKPPGHDEARPIGRSHAADAAKRG